MKFVITFFYLETSLDYDLTQARHGEFEPGKAQYSTPNFFDRLFLKERIETQNLDKAQALGALVAVAAL